MGGATIYNISNYKYIKARNATNEVQFKREKRKEKSGKRGNKMRSYAKL